MPSLRQELPPNGDQLRAIQLQQVLRHAADVGLGNDQSVAKFKVIRPAILTWMKQPHDPAGIRIDRGDISSFQPITFQATAREIRQLGLPIVLESDDVIRLERKKRLGFWQQAILALKAGTFANRISQSDRNVFRHGREAPLHPGLQHPHEQFRAAKVLQLILLLVGQRA